jgi:hypothetical protein
MEHVAKHLEKAAAGAEPMVEFGGDHDLTLTQWAASPDVDVVRRGPDNRWELTNRLKQSEGTSASRGRPRSPHGTSDEDAEGELDI